MNPPFQLSERTAQFALNVRSFLSAVPRTLMSIEDMKQLVRSSGSVAANYLEADEALSKKDFVFRIKISRKEARESALWLRLLSLSDEQDAKRLALINECSELVRIFETIVRNTKL